MYTAKHAMLIRDKYPDVNVTVFYIDVRTPGKNFDEFYRRAVEQYGVNYIKGQVGKVIPQPDGKLLVQGVDLLDNKQIKKEADMVVLAAAIEPNPDVRKIATMLTASIDTNNFLTEAHAKLRPVESRLQESSCPVYVRDQRIFLRPLHRQVPQQSSYRIACKR